MPFDDLPLEIVQFVFSLCCRSGVQFRIPQEPDTKRSGTTQVTLSLVCTRWREIALNTGVLWGDVAVTYDACRERDWGPTASFQFVRDWLNRAGMAPISLEIFVRKALESQIAAIPQALFSSFHVTNLDLVSYHSSFLVPTTNLSHLERLRLSLYDPAQMTDVLPRLPEMPSLKELHLRLRLRYFVDLTSIYLIPWQQLHVLTLSGAYWSSQVLFNILPRCKSLVECSLLVKLEYGQHENNIVLPNMENLVLDISSNASADSIIRSLTLPNLRWLDIRSQRSHTKLPLSTEAIVIMAQRSGFKRLTDFSLCLTEQPVDVRSLLGSMPALESVLLYGPLMFQPGAFADLSSGTIGPQLEEINIGDMSDEEIGLMLEAVGQRHEKAKTVSDIRPFASVTCCSGGSDIEFHKQRAKQCGEAFNARVEIHMAHVVLATGLILDSDEE